MFTEVLFTVAQTRNSPSSVEQKNRLYMLQLYQSEISYINIDESQKHNAELSPKQVKLNDILIGDTNMW